MVAVAIVMIVAVMTTRAGRRAAHGDAARFAELPVLRFHAGCDPGHVGNDVGTKPHRVGRARLTGRIAALGGCGVETTKQQCEQGNGAGQIYEPHVYPLDLATFCARVILLTRPAATWRNPSLPRSAEVCPGLDPGLDGANTCSPKRGENTISPALARRVVFCRNLARCATEPARFHL